MEMLFLYLVLAAVVGAIAGSWGRGGFIWFLISVLLSPVLGLVFLLIAGKPRELRLDRVTPATHVICPDCAEHVRKEARVCKHCGCRLVPVIK